MTHEYQLQVFDGKAYRVERTMDSPIVPMRERPRGVAWRCVLNDTARKKPLPLKPRGPYYRRATLNYRPETQIEPVHEITLVRRAIDWYEARLRRGESVTVYYWCGSRFGAEIRPWAKHRDNVKLVELDPATPGCAFGPTIEEQA